MCFYVNVFLLLLFNLYISLCTDIPDNPNNITLEVTSTTKDGKTYFKCNSLETYKLLEKNDAEVVLNHKNTINEAQCYFRNNTGIIYTGDFINRNKLQTRLKITNIQAGIWNCKFLTLPNVDGLEPTVKKNKIQYVQVQCTFNVHVRLLKGPSMTINNVPVETKIQDLSTTEYDYIGNYYFQPNKPVSIQCIRPLNGSGSMKLTMKSASTGSTITTVDYAYKDRNIYMILTMEHDKVYLDCSYVTLYNDLSLRVYMRVNDIVIDEKDSLIIKIDGDRLQPNPILNSDNEVTVNNLFYDITYSNNRELTITCDKDENTQGDLKLTSYNINGAVKSYEYDTIGSGYNKSFPTNVINNNSEIICSLNRDQEKSIYYVVKFTKMWPTKGLVLSGLNSKNIVMDYDESSGLVHYIQYTYRDNDTLNLSCYSNSSDGEIFWTINDNEKQAINSNYAQFKLDESYNNTVIKCRKTNKDSEPRIILTLSHQEQPDTIPPSTESTTELATPAGQVNPGFRKQWYIIGGIGTCIAIFLIGLLIFCLRRNKVKNSQTQPQGIDYETLQSQNGPASHFDICNTYSPALDEINDTQYSVPYKPDLKDLYARPIPKSQRTNQMASTDIYAEIDTNKHDNGDGNEVKYAELSLAKPKDIYAEVIPKGQRNAAMKDPENSYAEFYAEAIPQSQSNYGNISGNQRYINSDSRDDYAEPAYCELLVKRTMK